jgi:hypothetical protein
VAARWDILLCDRLGVVLEDITPIATAKKAQVRFNRPASFSFDVPSSHARVATIHSDGDPYLAPLSRVIKARRNGVMRFAGYVWTVADRTEGEEYRTGVVCFDPLQRLLKRLVRDAANAVVSKVSFSAVTAHAIAQAVVDRTNVGAGVSGMLGSGGTFGSIPSNTAIDYEYRSVASALSELADGGYLDIDVVPVDRTDGYHAQLNTYAALGTARENVVLGHGRGPNNCTAMTRTEDANTIANVLHYFGAQKTGDARVRALVSDATSRTKLGDYEDHDTANDIVVQAFIDKLAAESLAHRKVPRQLVSTQPKPNTVSPWDDFYLGDSFTVMASTKMRGGFIGTQRCHGWDIDIDEEGTETVSNIYTTPDA